MRQLRARWLLSAVFSISCLILLFQNCGPAQLKGAADTSSESGFALGSKVDLVSLLKSPSESTGNVLFPSPTTLNQYDYAQSAPVIENLVLLNNDFDRVEWVHEASSTVVAVGDALNQIQATNEALGTYYVFGYRAQTPFLITQFQLVEKGLTTLGVNSVGAVQISQKTVASDSTHEKVLLVIEAPAVDLKSVQFKIRNQDVIVDGKRALLVDKRLDESLDIDVNLTDTSDQTATNVVNLAAKTTPATTTTSTTTSTTTVPPSPTTTTTIPEASVSLQVQGAPNLPLYGTTTPVTVGFVAGTPIKVDLSRDGLPTFASWPSGTFFKLAADGKSLTGNWCISYSCWGGVSGAHSLKVVATYANGVTKSATVNLSVYDNSLKNVVQAMPISPMTVTGSTATVSYSITNAAPLSEDHMGFMQIVDLAGTVNYVADDFTMPISTTTWAGTVNISRTLAVPATLANGDYTVRVGFFINYSPWTRAKLNVGPGVTEDDETRYIIGKIRVSR